MEIAIFLVVVVLVLIGVFVIPVVVQQQRAFEAEAKKFRDAFQGWDVYVSPFYHGVLATHIEKGRIVVGTTANYIERDISCLASVSVEKDGQGLTVTNRGSQVMGAAVGGILLGPMGLLVGGLSGSKSHKLRVNELTLKITIDDPDMPVHRVVFFQMPGAGIDAKDWRVKPAAEQLERNFALLSNAIRSQNRKPDLKDVGKGDVLSIEDRLEKLWRLKEAGAITAAEFDTQKAQLLQ